MRTIIVKTPGRICLFGDHQDYMELPVIACAIDRCMHLNAIVNKSNYLNVHLKDLNQFVQIHIDEDYTNLAQGDYLKLALKVLRRYNCKPSKGYDIEIHSDIPINAGLSSSSAFTIAWVHFLWTAFSEQKEIAADTLAKIAYEIEVVEQASSGGKMDQFTIAHGNLIFLNTKTNTAASCDKVLQGLVIGVSGIPKDTLGTLSHLKQDALQAIRKIQSAFPNFLIENAVEEDLDKYADILDNELFTIFTAAVRNHLITQRANIELNNDMLDLITLGKLMNAHHEQLKNNLKITVPRIDNMIQAALKAGALGAKIVGSGMGGSITALCAPGSEGQIRQAILDAGAKDAFLTHQHIGSSINIF